MRAIRDSRDAIDARSFARGVRERRARRARWMGKNIIDAIRAREWGSWRGG
jgi:hypothetical protein